jgi:hypothetical protein
MDDKAKKRSDAAISFLQGFIGRKENKAPVAKAVRRAQATEEAIKNLRGEK